VAVPMDKRFVQKVKRIKKVMVLTT
jgi:hypothetical protein